LKVQKQNFFKVVPLNKPYFSKLSHFKQVSSITPRRILPIQQLNYTDIHVEK